ncbi:MAG: ECF transporter S component [Acholeplasmatales bacterium]|jgi:ECF transporter S component (folate family)|nr:ECF transporter S component [Acholeplasmataceae bacterium]MDY0115561.1 ECF transporter S component [Acholeplasmatales bacterium]MCK9233738.1 ECF transporter S component [Acholeplasmataceae bacterium]MCK9289020.1 ECF transporter S component [Acholeplasmataceae bacterium]MCK9427715.1 ECF transporter S component [Acholeplasmataceae bacterium]
MNKQITKITIGAVLAALSVVIRMVFDPIMPDNFNVPFYSIPLIIAGFMIGRTYGLVVGIVADTAMGLMSPYGYKPLFVFSSIAWSLLPALLTKEPKGYRWYLIIIITYFTAFLFNTMAMWIHYSKNFAMASFYLRLGLIIPFSFIIAYLTYFIYERVYKDIVLTK